MSLIKVKEFLQWQLLLEDIFVYINHSYCLTDSKILFVYFERMQYSNLYGWAQSSRIND